MLQRNYNRTSAIAIRGKTSSTYYGQMRARTAHVMDSVRERETVKEGVKARSAHRGNFLAIAAVIAKSAIAIAEVRLYANIMYVQYFSWD